MKLLDTTPKRVGDILTLLSGIVEDELENSIHVAGRHYPATERLQYLLFQTALEDAVKGLTIAHGISRMTNEDITKMCADMGMTVEQAIVSTVINHFADVIENSRDDEGIKA